MFNKENDVSGQAGKPIYAENQDNDGQTQHTEQTMELFAAVKAELQTVNIPVEDNYIFSETISSSHSENFNLNSNNILSHSSEEFLNFISSSYTKETLQDPSYNTLFDPNSCYN